MERGTFGYDRDFLNRYDSGVVVLQLPENPSSQVLVSPRYQAKVFTSTAEGEKGRSFGWVNYQEIASGELDPHMNAYGGENRMWIGPEGGQFSVFFPPGSEFVFDHWKTPAAVDSEPWAVSRKSAAAVSLQKETSFQNYLGRRFDTRLERRIELLPDSVIRAEIGPALDGLQAVAYRTENFITNRGQTAWSPDSGSVCIWILDMFPPSDQTAILLPCRPEGVVRSDYFGAVPSSRLVRSDSVVLFRADGKQRGKIGIPPAFTAPWAGSIDLENQVVTLVRFDIDTTGSYLRQEWRLHEEPYSGDAVNAYNDGPLDDGTQMGPFYELESVSPAAFLSSGETIRHVHTVFHFTGDPTRLEALVRQLFGTTTQTITAFLTLED